MLKLAVKNYLKSVGDKVLVPNPEYLEFINAVCLDVVIKRSPRFFWQKPIYTYDNFGLNDLLDVPLPEDKSVFLKTLEPLTPNYTMSDKFTVKGKIGPKIANLVSVDLSGGELVSLSFDLQDMVIQTIDYKAVQEMLKTKKVDLRGKYLRRLAQDKYNVVCLITKFIYINKPTTINVNVEKDLDESGDYSSAKFGIDDTGSVQSNKQKTITFNAGTKLAFEFTECMIYADGSIELLDKSEKVRSTNMIATPQDKVLLPNYCAHITNDHQNFDIPDSGHCGSLVDEFKSLSHLFNYKHATELKKCLLSFSLSHKKILKKLELFLLHCQQEQSIEDHNVVSLDTFDQDMLSNAHLIKLFKCLDLPMKEDKIIVNASSLDPQLVEGLLDLIQVIYHLDQPDLENLHFIISSCDLSKVHELIYFLQSVKFLEFNDVYVYQRLAKDSHVKRLLRSVGVDDGHYELNDNFEPILIMLYGQR